jgi:hypothetical protein
MLAGLRSVAMYFLCLVPFVGSGSLVEESCLLGALRRVLCFDDTQGNLSGEEEWLPSLFEVCCHHLEA